LLRGVAIGVAAGAGIGAAAGGVVGLAADLGRADTREQALTEACFVLGVGQSAVIADVTEEWSSSVDTRMSELGGSVYRRAKSEVRANAQGFGTNYFYPNDYFYPYEYILTRDSLYL
jgi:hypothetical protein